MSKDYILLKWGTLKGWTVSSKESMALIEKYHALGASMSCALQHDSPEQKAILRELIQQHDGQIFNDWDGKEYSKDEALDYLENYGKPKTANSAQTCT